MCRLRSSDRRPRDAGPATVHPHPANGSPPALWLAKDQLHRRESPAGVSGGSLRRESPPLIHRLAQYTAPMERGVRGGASGSPASRSAGYTLPRPPGSPPPGASARGACHHQKHHPPPAASAPSRPRTGAPPLFRSASFGKGLCPLDPQPGPPPARRGVSQDSSARGAAPRPRPHCREARGDMSLPASRGDARRAAFC